MQLERQQPSNLVGRNNIFGKEISLNQSKINSQIQPTTIQLTEFDVSRRRHRAMTSVPAASSSCSGVMHALTRTCEEDELV